MGNTADGDDRIRRVRAQRDAYVAGRDIYLTNNKSLDDELAKFRAINSQMRADMLTEYAAADETLQDAAVLLMHASPEAATGALRILLASTGVEEDLALSLRNLAPTRRQVPSGKFMN